MPSEFAPGIKDRLDKGDLSLLPVGEEIRLVRQLHDAKRAGRHEDFRVGTPSGLYSWAVPKGMPEVEGEKRLAVMQPIHSWGYKDFEGRLGHGYGEGTVRKLEELGTIKTQLRERKIRGEKLTILHLLFLPSQSASNRSDLFH